MPELSSGMAGDSRAGRDTGKIDLGRVVDGFLAAAAPDLTHLKVLAHLVRDVKNPTPVGDIAAVVRAPKAEVQAALERFEKLELAKSSLRLLGRRYAFLHEGPRSELAVKIVRLWEHPQTHEVILQRVISKPSSRPAVPGRP